ncbi:MAG: response regulator [Gemmatimonadales bacterium]|jgi:DNA-binding response OmpR family regulator
MDPIRVLIVDDEAELVTALEERLNLRGFQASGVTTGTEALARLAEVPFDVVLLDLKMPGLGGLEVIKRIKEEQPGLQVILLTGWGSEEDAKKGQELGAYDYLMKPVKISELVRVLLSACDREEEGS